jgi:outer membrane protein assembly factor BamA
MLLHKSHITAIIAVWALPVAHAQTSDAQTRTQHIEAERKARSQNLKEEEPTQGERVFSKVQVVTDKVFGNASGFRPVIGGLATGSGFALGPEYYRPDLANGNVVFRTAAVASYRLYELATVRLEFPRLANGRAFVELGTTYRNYPSLNYYGPGPDSKKSGRTDYRLEDTNYSFAAGVQPLRRLKIGVTGGYLQVNVGPGTDSRYASTEAVYTESQAPGIDRQSNFLRGGPFIQFDYRDRPGLPRRGGNYLVSYIYYDDRKLGRFTHRELNAEAQQYIPFFNEKRVIALRAKTELNYRNTNQVIPFFLQPDLGGSDDLRGFRPFRFYDNNMMVMNAEYRWEVMTGFDMAVFADAGKVFHRHAQLNFANLETSFGFGLRFNSRSSTFMRWDVGFSREGFQVWIKFNNVF